MGVISELGRLALCAWSPGGPGAGYVAAGTYVAADASFGGSTLELLSFDLETAKLQPLIDAPSPSRFCALDWSVPSPAHRAGLVAGGLADGSVRVWDAASLLRSPRGKSDASTALVASATKHTGPVSALAFNPMFSARLATGGEDGTVLVWDLANPAAAAARALASPAGVGVKEQVSAVAWNRRVQHILGTATTSGVMNVWDLKSNKQVFSIRNPRGRLRVSSLAWHPDVATQIVIACDEDEATGAVMWDLRNATAPLGSFTHHGASGVAAMSWCQHDTDLLMTSSRDARTVVVSVESGEIVSEEPPTANWNFDVKWSPSVPGMYLASAFDGRITVGSLMTCTTAPSVSSETANALAESFGEMASGFQSGMAPQSPRTVEAQRVTYNLNRPPKWLKRPVSISFGFGGLKASVSAKDGANVTIESVPENFPGLKESTSKLDGMLLDLTSDDPTPAKAWCEEASSAAETPRDKMAWDALAMMFQTDARRNVLKYLGYELPPLEAGDDIAMPVYGLARSPPLAVPVRPAPPTAPEVPENTVETVGQVDAVVNGTAGIALDGPAPWEVPDPSEDDANIKDSILDGDDASEATDGIAPNKPNGISGVGGGEKIKVLAGKSKEEMDKLIKRSVVVGDFKTAVEACLHTGRTADALIIAHAGGPDLWQHTQSEYLSKAGVSSSSSIVGAIAGPKAKMDSFIADAAEGGKDSWKEALAVLLTYSPTDEFLEACSGLGQRLLVANNHPAALFCFICAGNTRMATSMWMRERPSGSKSMSAMLADRIERLGVVVQRVRLLTAASLLGNGNREIGSVQAMDEVSGSVLCEFGALLAAQEDSSLAITYLSNLDPSYTCAYGSAENIRAKAEEFLSMEDNYASATITDTGVGQTYDSYNGYYGAPAQSYPAQPYDTTNQGYGVPPPAPAGPGWGASAQPSSPPPATDPYATAPPPVPVTAAAPPRPSGMFGSQASTAERSAYDPSAAYAAAPTYDQSSYQPPPPAPVTGSVSATSPYKAPLHSSPIVAPPPMPTPPVPPIPGGLNATMGPPQYGAPPAGNPYGGNMTMQSQSFSTPPLPPPPPADGSTPMPTSYHAKAKPGSGASLPPSAEVAVAEQRRTKPLSSSGTPGGPPRRSGSTSSSMSALGAETIYLEKADVSKIPPNQAVVVKSLRGSYMYALSLNQAPRYKKKMEDVNKRLGRLVAGLNAGLLEQGVVDLLIELGKSIEKGNYDGASGVVAMLTKQYWDSNSQWIQGLKRLIDCVLTGR